LLTGVHHTGAGDAALTRRLQPVQAMRVMPLRSLEIVQILFKLEPDTAEILGKSLGIESCRSRAQELANLPQFRRNLGFTAYSEGWALYAESLGHEMGFYKDPYQKFGSLAMEMRRACRLVVDTGIHAFGRTREQAIDYMVANTGETLELETAEVDRYIVWPGQATAYKLGELKIKALRARASAALGERFDVRRFHDVVIDGGAAARRVSATPGRTTGTRAPGAAGAERSRRRR